VLLELLDKVGIPYEIGDLGLFDLYTADEVMAIGTAAEVYVITKIDGRVIGDGNPKPVFRRLVRAFRKTTQNEDNATNRTLGISGGMPYPVALQLCTPLREVCSYIIIFLFFDINNYRQDCIAVIGLI
jgi:hypothetical protein